MNQQGPAGPAAVHMTTSLVLTTLRVLLVYADSIIVCCYGFHAVLQLHAVLRCAVFGGSGLSFTIPRKASVCHIAIQQSHAVLCVQSREVDWAKLIMVQCSFAGLVTTWICLCNLPMQLTSYIVDIICGQRHVAATVPLHHSNREPCCLLLGSRDWQISYWNVESIVPLRTNVCCTAPHSKNQKARLALLFAIKVKMNTKQLGKKHDINNNLFVPVP